MSKQITAKQYTIIDLCILAVILCVLEAASRIALNFFKNEIFTISLVLPISLIALMRHGAYGVSIAVLGGFVYCMINGAPAQVYLIYILGNSAIAANLLWFKKVGKEKMSSSKVMAALYVFTGYFFINIGRSLFAFVFGASPIISVTVRYFTTDALSAVMTFVIIIIAMKQDGVFEDQMNYLKRHAAEEEAKYAR